jgi:hypothetical protein
MLPNTTCPTRMYASPVHASYEVPSENPYVSIENPNNGYEQPKGVAMSVSEENAYESRLH